MLSPERKLEELLKRLFEDDDESDSEDVVVLKKRKCPLKILRECCTYSYTGYGG